MYSHWSIRQNIVLIKIDLMVFEADEATTFLQEFLKKSRPGYHPKRMVFKDTQMRKSVL